VTRKAAMQFNVCRQILCRQIFSSVSTVVILHRGLSRLIVRYVNLMIFVLLIGAEIDSADNEHNTALHLACRYDHQLLVTALLEHGANVTKFVVLGSYHFIKTVFDLNT